MLILGWGRAVKILSVCSCLKLPVSLLKLSVQRSRKVENMSLPSLDLAEPWRDTEVWGEKDTLDCLNVGSPGLELGGLVWLKRGQNTMGHRKEHSFICLKPPTEGDRKASIG